MPLAIVFDNSYARLPSRFYERVRPEPAPSPGLLVLNTTLAAELGLDAKALAAPDGVAALSGASVPEGADPIALAYAGHQFGHFVPALGDGRAVLLGELIASDGRRLDLQLKGSGRTVFSRRGDGKAAVGPVLREYLISEAMAAFGIPTTRSLAAVATGETVLRERPMPGAVLTRVAASHVRVGTFQYFAHRSDVDGARRLADYVIERLYPDIAGSEAPYAALFERVVHRQACLIALWLSVGFIHGVMNTDNMAISGETIDYGPCAFLDAYEPDLALSSIDRQGRYAYGRQAQIAQWNLARLGECLLPLLSDDRDKAVEIVVERLSDFAGQFEAAYFERFLAKIGLVEERKGDRELVTGLLSQMQAGKADFTLAFRRLADLIAHDADTGAFLSLFGEEADIEPWLTAWRARLAAGSRSPTESAAGMQAINPALIPRNHQVEKALDAIIDRNDGSAYVRLLQAVTNPFEERPEDADLAVPPRPEDRVMATFCGT
ncbi:YdiU family protein [Pleomorphomonas sp. JP5]|uniref:protein adenylyltransferase SelO n=1 Tax=Pleomorphomonas sp. JP5 TaxID=2942998 RepID=UPI0020433603|nr:YdiU family protein [Pleomorphomonas sp. JP5]MCM5556199.1 YdiU family protein [Pleomorphomonas sp. JP5]